MIERAPALGSSNRVLLMFVGERQIGLAAFRRHGYGAILVGGRLPLSVLISIEGVPWIGTSVGGLLR